MLGFFPISGGPVSGRKVENVAGGGLDAVVTLGQGSQSIAATGAVSVNATVALGQGSQSLAAVATVATAAAVTLGQGSQSVQAAGAVSLDSTIALGQGSQSVAALASVSADVSVTLGQGSQSIAATAEFTDPVGGALDATVTLGQGSQSIAAIVEATDPIVVPPGTGSQPGGAGGGRFRVSFEDADRIRKRLRDIETKRRKTWGEQKKFERQIEQIYEDLFETPYRDELEDLGVKESITALVSTGKRKVHDLVPLKLPSVQDLASIRQLLDLYQTYLDDEEAVALLLLL